MEPEDDQFQIKQEAKTHAVYALILDTSKLEGVGYSDLAGPFPYTSARGHRYIFFFYSWDANAILMEPMKNRGDTEMKRGGAVSLTFSSQVEQLQCSHPGNPHC